MKVLWVLAVAMSLLLHSYRSSIAEIIGEATLQATNSKHRTIDGSGLNFKPVTLLEVCISISLKDQRLTFVIR